MELLDKINEVLEKYKDLEIAMFQLDAICEKVPEEQSDIDKLLSDYYHIIENEELSDKAMIKICKKIHDVRKIRREYDKKQMIVAAYKRHKNKLMISPESNRAMFKHSIDQVVKDFPTTYNFRMLSEEEVNSLIGQKFDAEQLIEDLKNNEYTKIELAEKYGVSKSLVYYYSKKIKEK